MNFNAFKMLYSPGWAWWVGLHSASLHRSRVWSRIYCSRNNTGIMQIVCARHPCLANTVVILNAAAGLVPAMITITATAILYFCRHWRYLVTSLGNTHFWYLIQSSVAVVRLRTKTTELFNTEQYKNPRQYIRTFTILRITGFAFMIEFIGHLYNLLQHFTNHRLRLDTLDFWPHYTNPLLLESWVWVLYYDRRSVGQSVLQ
jgi:hypothetical protein